MAIIITIVEKVNMEVQFALNRSVTRMQVADFTNYIRNLLINVDGEQLKR